METNTITSQQNQTRMYGHPTLPMRARWHTEERLLGSLAGLNPGLYK